MDNLKRWLAEIEESVRALGSAKALDIGTPPSAALSRAVAIEGFLGVLPLWSGHLQTVGLLANPAMAPTAWPAVVLAGGQALTLASDSRTLLPQFIVHRKLSKLAATAERIAEQWNELESSVLTLHRILGGSEESLAVVAAAVRDPAQRRQFASRSGEAAQFEAAHSMLARQIDDSEPFTRYADWLDSCIQGRPLAPEAPESYGAWKRRVQCWTCRLRQRLPVERRSLVSTVHYVIEGNAGTDSGVPNRATWAARPDAASGETALVEAAHSILTASSSGDAVSDGLVKALTTEGTSYNGYAHAEAVVALEERGEPERAWSALESLAWWAARNSGQAPEATLDGAQLLAERHNWVDLNWLVERAREGA